MQAVAPKAEYSDAALVQHVQEGDKSAFEQLFFRYHSPLCGVAAKVTGSADRAQDVVQDVFLRIWKTRRSWQVNSSVHAYLYQAVWNEALNARKKHKNRCELNEHFMRHIELVEAPSEGSADTNKLVDKIWNIVETMPRRRRFVFMLHRKHGLTYKEIAAVMDITRKTVENHMGLALKEIRASL